MFHHFHDDKAHKKSQGSISKDDFYKIIKFIGRKNILNAETFFEKFRTNKIKSNEVCITFDDAIKSQIDIALPVLEDLKIKAFYFVYTSLFEGKPDNLEILNEAETPLPLGVIDKIDSEIETRLNARYLDLRKSEIAANFKIRAAVSGAVHKHLRREKFLEVQTPKIIASATEGGTSLFEMKYFDKTAYLAQSPQLYKQMLMGGGLERVYEIGPAFRAEEHNTPRHLNEFISIDIEMSFADDDVVMGVMERLVDSAARAVAKETEALETLGIEPIELNLPLPRITYDEAIEMSNGKAEWGEDLSMEATREIAAQMNGFYFITKWPLSLKPFYIQPDDDPKYSRGFDFMYNEVEMTSGGQRVHDVNMLRERLKEQGLDPDGFNHYLDPFRYGMPPHAGWGLGLDRLSMIFAGAKNVRECVLFPRDRTRMTP